MDEKETIRRILKGETESYRLLVERYQTGLIIHCENLLKDRDDGEDVAQEAFIKAYQHLDEFSAGKGAYSTWLYRIATNICIDHLRKDRRKVDVKDIEAHLDPIDFTPAEEEENRLLREMIEQLEPPKYAALIKAYFWEGKSYKELAKLHRTSTGTIGTWMSRAKAQLKEKLS